MTPGTDSIVITGMGLACSLGISPEEAFEAIIAGRCSLGPMSELEQPPSPDKGGGQAAELPELEPADAPREVRYLRYAVAQALRSAGPHPYAPARVGCVMGTTLHGMRAGGRWLRGGAWSELRAFPAGAVLQGALRSAGIGGAKLSTCSACSSALSAIALAATLLRTGDCDMVLAGGYDAVSEYAYAGFDSLRLVSAGPVRPFSAERDGMKTAEGYAVVVLEREREARLRAARIRGVIAGVGESADSHHLTQPHPEGEGARSAIVRALRDAGLAPAAAGLICAHATATPGNDASEYAALRGALGDALPAIPVVAFKSQLGHTLGACGAVELILSVLARERGVIPPTLNAEPTDPAFAGLHLNHGKARRASIMATLNLSLGFGGANTCIAVTSSRVAPPAAEAGEPVITGVGVVMPGAIGNERFVELLSTADGRAAISGPVPDEAIAHLLRSRRVRRMSDYVKLTLAAATVAREHAGLDGATTQPGEECILLGTMHGSSNFCESFYSQVVREGLASANPALFAEGVPNAAAAQLSLMLGVRGACQTIIGSRCAGLDAIRLAALRIREGVWTRAFVGAGEEYSETVNRASTGRCIPRGATVTAGAVILVLEARRAAEARGARIIATIGRGWSGAATASEIVRRSAADSGGHGHIVTSCSDGPASGPEDRDWSGDSGYPHWSVHRAVAECYSVGGPAALAAVLLGPQTMFGESSVRGSVLVVATDAATGATAVRVEV